MGNTFKSDIPRNLQDRLNAAAKHAGFESVESFVEEILRQSRYNDISDAASYSLDANLFEVFSTGHGSMICGNALSWLRDRESGSVDLILTSPPFGLIRKKEYGNFSEREYVEWFLPFGREIKRVLTEKGSVVLDIGGGWLPGLPARSIYNFKLLIALVEEVGLYLCQEHYWWNPSKLPTPVQWVNVERVRVKDSVNTIWWLSKTPHPKASNKRVLQPYSQSMRTSLERGYGKPGAKRPSGHSPSSGFSKDNGGSIPPNLLAIANTASRDSYTDYCRDMGYKIHPARFPRQIPEYFIRLLTDKGDLVVDPFAGSCVSGAAAEYLGRKWICIDINDHYLQGAIGRFRADSSDLCKEKQVRRYEISSPQYVRYKRS